MSIWTRLFLGLAGILLITVGGMFIWNPDVEAFMIIAGIIGFVTGGGLLAIAFFK